MALIAEWGGTSLAIPLVVTGRATRPVSQPVTDRVWVSVSARFAPGCPSAGDSSQRPDFTLEVGGPLRVAAWVAWVDAGSGLRILL